MSSTSPTDPPAKPSRLRRYLVRALFLVACLATLIATLFIVEKYRGRAAWRAYETEAKARGVKLDFADYIPPKIPDAENFASIPLFEAVFRASDAGQPIPNPLKLPVPTRGKLPKFNDPAKQERIDLAAWQKFFVEAKLLPAAGDSAAADVLQALAGFATPLAQLRDAGTRPHCHFPIHWEKAFAAALPHLEILQSASKLFALRLSAHLALGDSAAAYEDFRTGLRLATATAEEPTLIAGLVRLATVTAMENAVWGGLAGQQWAEPELRKIEADLAGLDGLKDYLFALGSERGGSNQMTDMLIGDPRQFAALMPAMAETPSSTWGSSAFPSGWLYQNKVRANHFFDESAARIDPGQRRYFGERPIPSSATHLTSLPARLYYMLFCLSSPVVESLEKRWIQAATVTDQTRLACALERFRLARGAFPQALSELAPDFLPAVPAEIVNGEPYRYRRTDDGSFALHSVGTDLRDDSGVIVPMANASKQADWVWRYPAK